MAVALVISYNIAMVNRQRGSLDSGTTVNPTKKKKPRRLGLYKEGKSMIEKIVKETFSPDEVEEANKPVKKIVKNAPKDDERFIGEEVTEKGATLSKPYMKVKSKK